MARSDSRVWSAYLGEELVANRIEVAEGFWRRLRGLLGRSRLDPGEGMWLQGTNGVHTVGMRFPIDVLFLDGRCRILAIKSDLPPGRTARAVPGALSCLELAAGMAAAKQLSCGDTLVFKSNSF